MIECYYRECKHHCKDEPFCELDDCEATTEAIEEFKIIRRELLQQYRDEAS